MNDGTESCVFAERAAAEPPMGAEEEADLVERARREPAAFGELYEIYYTPILNYLYYYSAGIIWPPAALILYNLL